jgi:hypothetical protein
MVVLSSEGFAGGIWVSDNCEQSVSTVFQLPNPDAIYSRDEEKERKVGAILCCLCSRTVYVLLRQGRGQEGRKRLTSIPT